MIKKKNSTIYLFFILSFIFSHAVAQQWPTPLPEAKPGTRWWWLGSAVDKANLQWNLSEYARVGIGAVEITPLYGVQGNDKNNIPFLSPQWMQALKTVEDIAKPLGIEVDMNCGTGWPFGGPQISLEQAACKAIFKDTVVSGSPTYTVEIGRTKQKVKRAAPGGEGWVVDHFDREAIRHYLDRFERAFAESGVPYPHTFFNDSYEVYKANWTPTLFDEFQKRRGYDLRTKLPELLGTVDDGNQVLADYRETLSDLLLENFTQQWVAWAHQHGVKVRNQAHGSPANLLDLYDTQELQRRIDAEICIFSRSCHGETVYQQRDLHVAHGTFPHLAVTDEARPRPDVYMWRQSCLLPWFLLYPQGRPLARLEVLCLHRHESNKLHLARRPLPHAIHRKVSEFPAVGTARQRLPRLSARS